MVYWREQDNTMTVKQSPGYYFLSMHWTAVDVSEHLQMEGILSKLCHLDLPVRMC